MSIDALFQEVFFLEDDTKILLRGGSSSDGDDPSVSCCNVLQYLDTLEFLVLALLHDMHESRNLSRNFWCAVGWGVK